MSLTLPIHEPLRVAGKTLDDGPIALVHDPYRREIVGEVVQADEGRASEAARAAVAAFAAMRTQASFERRRVLRRVAEGVAADAEAFAELIAREAGKPITLARAEVARAVSTLELGAEEATRVSGETLAVDTSESTAGYSASWTRVPAGPVLAFAPFNFPLNLVCHKVAPALACGCPIVLKPPPQAPLTSLRLAAIVREAGAVRDALQVVPCNVEVAGAMVRDERFAVLSFTGSAKAGWYLKSLAGKKRVLLELGGNAAVIVHEDADLAWAAGRTLTSAFAYAGQVCISAQRLFVHASVHDAFVDVLARRASAVPVRDPLDDAAIVGPLIDDAAAERVALWVDEAVHGGARVIAGGTRERNRMEPTLVAIDGFGRGLRLVDEEVFGPVLTVQRYETWDQAIAMANAGRYGLQAGVFTREIGRIQQAFRELDVGGVIVNDAPSFRVDSMPYGGVRDLGLGREGVRFAIDEMTEKRLLVIRA